MFFLTMDKVESVMKALESDLENYRPALHDPIDDARTYRKILRYLFTCVVEEKDRTECKDWLYKLYEEQTDDEKVNLTTKVDLLANALYGFYEYLKSDRRI